MSACGLLCEPLEGAASLFRSHRFTLWFVVTDFRFNTIKRLDLKVVDVVDHNVMAVKLVFNLNPFIII